ncbi:unnamed protein product [Tuwongella immobilis]|uniref:Uncharacterized protein n=1 Tax=Tuwongella immobilis TaxID=692036 RepID=A0A6C2YXU5_9BACT|nr:unnamed protein product [Tuwongella immobilis]VTS08714.1 unnamed protein product [Tuwongella immobilis]
MMLSRCASMLMRTISPLQTAIRWPTSMPTPNRFRRGVYSSVVLTKIGQVWRGNVRERRKIRIGIFLVLRPVADYTSP